MKARTEALTRASLVEGLSEALGLNQRESARVVSLFFDEIVQSLVRGESVKLSGFGHFHCRDKPSRPGRNPKTGDIVQIAARRVVTFHPSQTLAARIAILK